MLRTPEELREMTSELTIAVWTTSAIAALLESGLAEHLREPRSLDEIAARCPKLSRGRIETCIEVAAAAGVVVSEPGQGGTHRLSEGALPFSQEPMRTALVGDLRTQLMQALAFMDRMRGGEPPKGWQHTNEILQTQGDASMVLAPMMKMRIAPQLGDLSARLERPGARFLDVGVGVASLAIAMARVFPNLHIVGLDVYDPSLALARANIERAKLEERIELTKCPVEELEAKAPFTLAWLPTFFIANVAGAIARIHASLEPGGFIFCGAKGDGGSDRQRAVWSLVNEEWGGPQVTPPDVEALLTKAGFTNVKTLPGPTWAPSMVVAQKAS